MNQCFDAMKRPIPCQWQDVVQVPEPAATLGWELAIAGVGMALALWMVRAWRRTAR